MLFDGFVYAGEKKIYKNQSEAFFCWGKKLYEYAIFSSKICATCIKIISQGREKQNRTRGGKKKRSKKSKDGK